MKRIDLSIETVAGRIVPPLTETLREETPEDSDIVQGEI